MRSRELALDVFHGRHLHEPEQYGAPACALAAAGCFRTARLSLQRENHNENVANVRLRASLFGLKLELLQLLRPYKHKLGQTL